MRGADDVPTVRTPACVAALVAWGACGILWWLVAARLDAGDTDGLPGLIRAAVRGGVITPADAWASAMRRLACALALISLPWVFPQHWARRRELAAALVGESTPETVAFLRIVVTAVLLGVSFAEDLSSIALLPESSLRPKGVLLLLDAVPGFHAFSRDGSALRAFAWLTRGLLGLALVGYRGRATVPAAAMMMMVFGGLLRGYANSFHAGLLPVWLLLVLSFFPTTDTWSLDAWRSRSTPAHHLRGRGALYGWARYTFWSVLSLAYFAAGTSKLFNGGPLWWEPNNMRVILAMDGLNPMELPFRLGLPFATGPAWPLALLGLSALSVELGMISMLFSQRLRWVMPAAMLATHVGIALLQNVLFADLIVLLAAFYAQRWTDRCSASQSVYLEQRNPISRSTSAERDAAHSRGSRVFAAFACTFIVANLVGIELYPLTGMQMYSRRNHDGVVRYHRIVAIDALGHEKAAHPEHWVGALRDSRYRFHLHRCFDDGDPRPCRDFLSGFAQFLAASPAHDDVVALEAQEWRWSIRDHPSDPGHGAIHARVSVAVE